MWDPGSDVHVEINEGGKYSRRMPIEIVTRLAKLGWRVPVKKPFPIRNCWLRVGRPEGDDGPPNPRLVRQPTRSAPVSVSWSQRDAGG